MVARKIDPEALQRMWDAGVPSEEIAAHFGTNYPSINKAAKALGLPPRTGGRGRPRKEQESPAPKPSVYAAIAEAAQRDGITLMQALCRFHRTGGVC